LVTIIEEAAVVSAAGAILLAVFAVVQLRHAEKHRNVDVSMRLFEWAEEERLRKAFKWIEHNFHFTNYAEFRVQESSNVEASEYPFEVIAFFEQIGFLVEKKFVDFDVIHDRLGRLTVSNWQRLAPWIQALRKEKNDPTFGEHFQRLYQRTIKEVRKD
jgi:hypothetical protein